MYIHRCRLAFVSMVLVSALQLLDGYRIFMILHRFSVDTEMIHSLLPSLKPLYCEGMRFFILPQLVQCADDTRWMCVSLSQFVFV